MIRSVIDDVLCSQFLRFGKFLARLGGVRTPYERVFCFANMPVCSPIVVRDVLLPIKQDFPSSSTCYVESGIHLTDALEPGAAAA